MTDEMNEKLEMMLEIEDKLESKHLTSWFFIVQEKFERKNPQLKKISYVEASSYPSFASLPKNNDTISEINNEISQIKNSIIESKKRQCMFTQFLL